MKINYVWQSTIVNELNVKLELVYYSRKNLEKKNNFEETNMEQVIQL